MLSLVQKNPVWWREDPTLLYMLHSQQVSLYNMKKQNKTKTDKTKQSKNRQTNKQKLTNKQKVTNSVKVVLHLLGLIFEDFVYFLKKKKKVTLDKVSYGSD